uniref:Uncharacterized protein n=1 Tax=Anguilla anguilla TaxID=7936 RepID=A0A0E9R9E0_ANGAN
MIVIKFSHVRLGQAPQTQYIKKERERLQTPAVF